MELATVQLKLSGSIGNTVVKNKVTPAQLALYAFMHGEDCVQSLKVIGIDKNRTAHAEMNRLRMEFTSENASKTLAHLFPGASPHLPLTFKSMGYDPSYFGNEESSNVIHHEPKSSSEKMIKEKIKQAEDARRLEKIGNKQDAPEYEPVEIFDDEETGGAFDDTGDFDIDDDEEIPIVEDLLDAEMRSDTK